MVFCSRKSCFRADSVSRVAVRVAVDLKVVEERSAECFVRES